MCRTHTCAELAIHICSLHSGLLPFPVPPPSSLVTSVLSTDLFYFLGFLPAFIFLICTRFYIREKTLNPDFLTFSYFSCPNVLQLHPFTIISLLSDCSLLYTTHIPTLMSMDPAETHRRKNPKPDHNVKTYTTQSEPCCK